MTTLVHQAPGLRIYRGEAVDLPDDVTAMSVDLVLTNPYGPLPPALHSKPMLIHQWRHRKAEAERWCGNALAEISGWNDDREVFWCANLGAVIPVDLHDLRPEPPGWYPLDLPLRLLRAYGSPGITVWDGFMGRGTVARACRELGMQYIGVERLQQHLDIAFDYLGVPRGTT